MAAAHRGYSAEEKFHKDSRTITWRELQRVESFFHETFGSANVSVTGRTDRRTPMSYPAIDEPFQQVFRYPEISSFSISGDGQGGAAMVSVTREGVEGTVKGADILWVRGFRQGLEDIFDESRKGGLRARARIRSLRGWLRLIFMLPEKYSLMTGGENKFGVNDMIGLIIGFVTMLASIGVLILAVLPAHLSPSVPASVRSHEPSVLACTQVSRE